MSVYIVVSGPDADKRIARHVTFCSSVKGRTSLSCSGMAPSYTTYIRANSHVGSRQPAHHTHNTCPTPRPSSAASAIANGRAKGGLLFAGVVWGSFEGRLRILTAAAALQPFLEPRSGRLLEDVRLLARVQGFELPASLEGVAEVVGLAEQSRALLNTRTAGTECKLGWRLAPHDHSPLDMSRIAILTCDSKAAHHLAGQSPGSLPFDLPRQQSPAAVRGDPIMAIGSPFGVAAPDFFSNMVVSGIIARVNLAAPAGSQSDRTPALLLADLAALPGMEGSPMLSAAGKLVGMLTFPVTVAGHEIPIIIPTASLAEAVSACLPSTAECQRDVRSCMRHEGNAVQGTRITTCATSQPPVQLHEHTLQQLRQFKQQGSHGGLQQGLCGIVGVTLPNGHWASGIIVSKGGVLLTSAHLFDHLSPMEARRVRVRVVDHTAHHPQWHDARVLHIMTGAQDLAFLQMLQPPEGLQPLQPSTTPPLAGTQCLVAGHALFNPVSGAAPMLTAGNVSKVLSIPDPAGQSRAAMVLTTAAVHVGASGGAILSHTGQLLGMVTSNTKHASGTTIPTLNYSIAAEWMRELWQHIQQSKVDELQLKSYDDKRLQLLKLWSLQPFMDNNMPQSKL